MRQLSLCRVVIPILLAASISAFADPAESSKDSGATANVPAESAKTKPPSFWESPTLTGEWGGLRKTAEDRGITMPVTYTVDLFGNPLGGNSQGVAYTGVLSLGTNIDFEKLVGWKGASFGMQWYWIDGQDLSARHINNLFTVDGLAGFSTFRLGSLWFQQNLFSDKFSLRVGILSLDSEFDNSAVGSLFVNSAFGWSPFLTNNIPNGGPQYPMGAPGIRLALNPVNWFTYQAAITQGNVYPQNVNRHGFRWRLSKETGFLAVQEAIFHLNPTGKYWGNYRFGSWLFSGDTPSPADPSVNLHNTYGFYFMGEQMILPTSAEDKNQGLSAFGHIAFAPPHRNTFELYVDGGLTYTGICSCRPNDSVGIALAYGELSNRAILGMADDEETRPSRGGEFLLEATYRCQVTGWMTIQPDLQYIVNPGGVGAIPNALVLGVRAAVNF